jgi:hypothetical protein
MIDQPIAHHYQVEQHEYVIVENFRSTYPICLEGFLILDKDVDKYNYYLISYNDGLNTFEAKDIVKYYLPLPLEIARVTFPSYNLTEENYGF